MAGGTKNVGQVAGIHISNSAPENTLLIWYDNNSSQKKHKVYDPTLNRWVAINPQVVTATSYQELVNSAKSTGLSVGTFFQLTDLSNVLAIAITTTKVQYNDTKGNIIVDDLGSGKEYHISSSNLLIDGLNGIFDTTTNQLIFNFSDDTPDVDNDYLLGKKKSGTSWKLVKFAIKKFLSSISGNSLSWNSGFYFNFSNAISNILNKDGGIVGKDAYEVDKEELNRSITNISQENQDIATNAKKYTDNATTPESIYGKKIPEAPNVSGEPGDVKKGDTLQLIIGNIQKYINKFKLATGIKISPNFADATRQQFVNNNDTVESAIGKLQYLVKHITVAGLLPEDWQSTHDGLNEDVPVAGDTIDNAFAKVVGKLQQLGLIDDNGILLPQDWEPTNSGPNDDVRNLDSKSVFNALEVLAGKLQQLGLIDNSGLHSKNKSDNNRDIGRLGLDSSMLEFCYDGYNAKYSNREMWVTDTESYGTPISASTYNGIYTTPERFLFRTQMANNSVDLSDTSWWSNGRAGALFECNDNRTTYRRYALSAYNRQSDKDSFDAGFGRILLGRQTLQMTTISAGSYYVAYNESFILCNGSSGSAQNVYLPNSPAAGTIVYIAQGNNNGFNVYAQGNNRIDTIGESAQNVSINSRGSVFQFIWIPGIHYNSEQSETVQTDGMWQVAKLSSAF